MRHAVWNAPWEQYLKGVFSGLIYVPSNATVTELARRVTSRRDDSPHTPVGGIAPRFRQRDEVLCVHGAL